MHQHPVQLVRRSGPVPGEGNGPRSGSNLGLLRAKGAWPLITLGLVPQAFGAAKRPGNSGMPVCRAGSSLKVHKPKALLAVLGVLVTTLPSARATPSTPFFPHAWDEPSGRPPVAFLFVGLGLLVFAGFCLSGAIASAETLKKWSRLTGSENPLISRIACIVGVAIFTTMAGMYILGWFRVW
jgi:hypothetical protein